MRIVRRKPEAAPPAVQMADIAFNLVLFFLIVAKTQDESFVKWNPVKTDKVERAGHSKVTVTADMDGKIYVNGRQVGLTDVAKEVEQHLGDLPAGKRTVLLKVSREVQAGIFEPLIEAISQSGGEIVHVLQEVRPG